MLDIFKDQEGKFLYYLMAANSEMTNFSMNKTKENAIEIVKDYLKKADNGYSLMHDSLNSLTDSERSNYNIRLKVYKEKIDEIKTRIVGNKTKELRNAADEEDDKIQGSLDNVHSLGLKSEEIGVKSLVQLKNQREITDGYDKIETLHTYALEADKANSSLNYKKIKLKLSMILIVFLEFIIMILVLIIKLG